jgi:hypothetical protein
MAVKSKVQAGKHVRCFTRALKNARYLKQMDPETFVKDKNAEGFGTGVPIEILQHLHRLMPESAELKGHKEVSEFLKQHKVLGPEKWQR